MSKELSYFHETEPEPKPKRDGKVYRGFAPVQTMKAQAKWIATVREDNYIHLFGMEKPMEQTELQQYLTDTGFTLIGLYVLSELCFLKPGTLD